MKVFVIDLDYCNGCHGCQIACKDEHCGNDWMPYSLAQPNTGQFWLKVKETEHGQTPKVKVEYLPWLCMHCESPACMQAVPKAVYQREDGLVIIDPEKSKGHKELVEACPYGAIFWNPELNIPQKCTGCAELVDEGKLPHCVDLCATGGMKFGEMEEFADVIKDAEVMLPESGTKPRVYYLNLPKLFLSGEVWDPKANEVIEGATVTLVSSDGQSSTVKTDDFGDFWFKRLEAGKYSLTIQAEGFEPVSLDSVNLDKSLNIGDFPLVAV